MQTVRVKSIETYEVENLPVYNLELESLEDKDDLFFIVQHSGIVSHNCVRKDGLMLNEFFPQMDFLLQAYKVHEYMPKFVIDEAGDLEDKTVLLLGYTFKSDTDDVRDSLTPKIIRYAKKKNVKRLFVHEPNLPKVIDDQFENIRIPNHPITKETVEELKKANDLVVIVCMNHSEFTKPLYRDLCTNALKVVDIWGILSS